MVPIKTLINLATFAASAFALNVDCVINGVTVATVDLDTGVCPFPIPEPLPVVTDIVSLNEYFVDFYYLIAEGGQYWNDIANAGRTIDVPAAAVFNNAVSSLFAVNAVQTPSNSTAALRKRFFEETKINHDTVKRADAAVIAQVVAQLETLTGTVVDPVNGGSYSFEAVVAADQPSSSVTALPTGVNNGTVTQTNTDTTVITITSCSDDKCHVTTAPATKGPVTTTIEGTETVYTTWCPIANETNIHTKIITVTKCDNNECHVTTTPATQSPITYTIAGTETVYTTWCPVEETSTAAPIAPTGVSPISTYEGAGARFAGPLAALAVIPLLNLL